MGAWVGVVWPHADPAPAGFAPRFVSVGLNTKLPALPQGRVAVRVGQVSAVLPVPCPQFFEHLAQGGPALLAYPCRGAWKLVVRFPVVDVLVVGVPVPRVRVGVVVAEDVAAAPHEGVVLVLEGVRT